MNTNSTITADDDTDKQAYYATIRRAAHFCCQQKRMGVKPSIVRLIDI
jgi:hypothetical protein